MTPKREYHSETRERARATTRDTIIRALIAVILDDGVHAFTMQNVAARAHVALRTVYRHFASRAQLLEGLSEYMDEQMARLGFEVPADAAALGAVARPLYDSFGAIGDAVRASVIASIATGYRSAGHVRRWAVLEEALAAAYPALDAAELRDASAIIGLLSGSRTWYVMTSELRLDADAGGRAVDWGLRTLLDDLARRNAATALIRRKPRIRHDARKRAG